MATTDDFLSLKQRVLLLAINLTIIYLAFVVASGLWLPTGGLESIWVISALALWLLSLLSAPWFLPPRDALANGITATIILIAVDLMPVVQFRTQLNVIRWVAVGYCLAVIGLSLAALFLHEQDQRAGSARLAFRLTNIFGRGDTLYTAPALVSIVGAYQGSLPTAAGLLILWVLMVVARPVERIAAALRLWKIDEAQYAASPSVGTIDRVDHPDIIRVRVNAGSAWKAGALYIAAMPNGDQRYVFALFSQVQGTDVIGTGLCVTLVNDTVGLPPGHVCASHDEEKAAQFMEGLSGSKGAELIGFTVENSTIGTLRFEVASDTDLAEGNVIFARVSGEDVFYQILDAETAEESFDQNPRGTHIVRAAQLGRYSAERGFTKYPWLPAMNSPLFAAHDRTFPPPRVGNREFELGKVPSTNIGVIANIDDLVSA